MTGWTVIVPAKPWHLAKSRLRTARRPELARAFVLDLLDVLESTDEVGRIVLVSAEPELHAEARRRDLALVADRAVSTLGRLNTAVAVGRHWAVAHAPTAPVAVLPADLPCLTPGSLSTVLRALAPHARAYVPDYGRGGTTLVTAQVPARLRSAYGPGSAARHARLELHGVIDAPIEARRDVDTVEDLAAALALGVGPRTRAAADPRSRLQHAVRTA